MSYHDNKCRIYLIWLYIIYYQYKANTGTIPSMIYVLVVDKPL
jgi:hypothetical protein